MLTNHFEYYGRESKTETQKLEMLKSENQKVLVFPIWLLQS